MQYHNIKGMNIFIIIIIFERTKGRNSQFDYLFTLLKKPSFRIFELTMIKIKECSTNNIYKFKLNVWNNKVTRQFFLIAYGNLIQYFITFTIFITTTIIVINHLLFKNVVLNGRNKVCLSLKLVP